MNHLATLTTAQAAEYVGARSVGQFRREVARGVWPEPYVKDSRPQRWRRADLDLCLSPERPSPQDRQQLGKEALDLEFGI